MSPPPRPESVTVLEAEIDRFLVASIDRTLPGAAGSRIRSFVLWLVFLLIVVGGLMIRIATMTAAEDLWWVMGSMVTIIGPIVLMRWLLIRWRLSTLPPDLQSVVRLLRSLPSGRLATRTSSRSERAIDAIRSLGPGIDGLIGKRVAEEIRTIEVTDLLLEPEPLAEGGRPTWGFTSVLKAVLVFVVLPGFYLAMATTAWIRFSWLGCGLPMLVLAALLAKDLPWFARWRRQASRSGMRDVVGPGFLVSRGRIWSRQSSVLVLHRPMSVQWKVEAMLLGPAGIRRFRFHDRHDDDLIRFMRHWCHRSPRPDLALGVLASLDQPS